MWNNIYNVLKTAIITALCIIGLAQSVDAFIEYNRDKAKQIFMFDDLRYGYDKHGNCYAYHGTYPYNNFTYIPCDSIDIMNREKVDNELNMEKAIEELRRKDSGL